MSKINCSIATSLRHRYDSDSIPNNKLPCQTNGFLQTAVSKARRSGLPLAPGPIPPARFRYSTNVFFSFSTTTLASSAQSAPQLAVRPALPGASQTFRNGGQALGVPEGLTK